MKKFKIGSHTSDKTIIAESDTYEGLFITAMKGLAFLLKGNEKTEYKNKVVKSKITIESVDSSCLIVDFLSEVLSQSYVKKAIFEEVEFDYLTETTLSADIKGIKTEKFEEDIKAITYFGARIKNKNGIYTVKILIDI